MKKIIYGILIITLLLISYYLITLIPYHIYTLAITEGLQTEFLTLNQSPNKFLNGKIFPPKKEYEFLEDKDLFLNFHLSHFEMMLPFNNALFSLIPILKISGEEVQFGSEFRDGNNTLLLSFFIERVKKVEFTSKREKLFTLPIFKNYIDNKTPKEIWRDIFYKKLSLAENNINRNFENIFKVQGIPIKELVYNLFILYNRKLIFTEEFEALSYNFENEQGVVELKSPDPKYTLHKLYIFHKSKIYNLLIKTRINNRGALNLRDRMLYKTKYKESNKDSGISIYNDYKRISYQFRTDQQGMTYLLSSWSHDVLNKEYVRLIILFLERGKLNLKYLKPFYEYAFKKFGTNLSNSENEKVELPNEILKRKMNQELENEVDSESKKTTDPRDIESFDSDEEKIQYYLKKAKETKKDSDKEEKVFIIN